MYVILVQTNPFDAVLSTSIKSQSLTIVPDWMDKNIVILAKNVQRINNLVPDKKGYLARKTSLKMTNMDLFCHGKAWVMS